MVNRITKRILFHFWFTNLIIIIIVVLVVVALSNHVLCG
jgi:hypothetical protein